jgi:hypothetical protein
MRAASEFFSDARFRITSGRRRLDRQDRGLMRACGGKSRQFLSHLIRAGPPRVFCVQSHDVDVRLFIGTNLSNELECLLLPKNPV